MNSCRTGAVDGRGRRRVKRLALTLLEMMVAVTLLAVIMIGLLMMFNQTQKALRIANAQTDVLENARGAIQLISRDLTEMTLHPNTNYVRSTLVNVFPSPLPNSLLPLPGTNVPVEFTDAYWLTRMNDTWQGVGYFVLDESVARNPNSAANYGVGTLYRFSTNVHPQFLQPLPPQFPPPLHKAFTSATLANAHRVSDGLVHFAVTGVFVTNTAPAAATNFQVEYFPADANWPNALPAFVDVELGILEPEALKQFHALKDLSIPVAQDFLRNHAAQIHFFRERVSIRNFINPYRENEVP